jgi:predicted enzyme related to lactoylglutathione lyase
MTEVTAHAPGRFSWVELVANDAFQARHFYTDLFGWDVREIPMGPDSVYVVFQSGGRDVAAMYPRGPEEREGGPSHWRSYVSVASSDESAAKARDLGARILAEPFDVFDVGRMAMLEDPSGAALALWEPRGHPGMGRIGEPGALCWNELLTHDVEAAGPFYAGLFGWEVRELEFGTSVYTVFETEGRAVAGMMAMPGSADAPPNWLPYFGASDCDDRARAAQIAGGATYVSPTDIPGVGRFAVLGDPQGATFAILREAGWDEEPEV